MATLSEIVEEKIGASLRSKLSRTSESSLASVASLSMPLIQEIVLSADIRCSDCQERVADIMSRMIETYSILESVLEKKVTLTCTNSGDQRVVSKTYGESLLCKISTIRRLICPSKKHHLDLLESGFSYLSSLAINLSKNEIFYVECNVYCLDITVTKNSQ